MSLLHEIGVYPEVEAAPLRIIGALAEFERDLIRERTMAGLQGLGAERG